MKTIKKAFKIVRNTVIGAVALFVIFCIYAITSTDDTTTEKAAEEPKAAEQTKTPAKAEPVAAAPAKPAQAELEQQALKILQDSYAGNSTVTFDKEMKSFNITPIDPAFKEAIGFMQQGLLLDEWESMKAQFEDGSKSLQGLLGDGYIINLQNPANTDNTLLMLSDGIVFYDFAAAI
jgi:hypothetical protein